MARRAERQNPADAERSDLLILADSIARLQTETAFEVLARAAELERQGRDIINLENWIGLNINGKSFLMQSVELLKNHWIVFRKIF